LVARTQNGRNSYVLTREHVVTDATTAVDYDKLIREGLKVLFKGDAAVLQAAMPLAVLDNLDLSGLITGIEYFTIIVDDAHQYECWITQPQYDYLSSKENTADLEALYRAVLKVVANVYNQVAQALRDLAAAWDKPPKASVSTNKGGGGVPVPSACCILDGVPNYGMSSSDCTALQGMYRDPCSAIPPQKPKE
jgi:hypothetical protein